VRTIFDWNPSEEIIICFLHVYRAIKIDDIALPLACIANIFTMKMEAYVSIEHW
jgi:hypothetical protein